MDRARGLRRGYVYYLPVSGISVRDTRYPRCKMGRPRPDGGASDWTESKIIRRSIFGPFPKTGGTHRTLSRQGRGGSRLFFDAFDHEILEGFIPTDDGIHAGFGKVSRPETPSRIL